MIITKENGMKICVFGTGDIAVTLTQEQDNNYHSGVCFKNQEPREIGEYQDNHGQTVEEHDPDIWFVFEKIESLDVVIEVLQALKLDLVRAKLESEE